MIRCHIKMYGRGIHAKFETLLPIRKSSTIFLPYGKKMDMNQFENAPAPNSQ